MPYQHVQRSFDAVLPNTGVRDGWARLAPTSTGAVYPNYLGQEEHDSDRLVPSAFGSNYERLVEIKTRYDPVNVFRLNQNIEPRITGAAPRHVG
jgi:hypothetical protein